jgi:SPP1 gp7 family putative phage head morphogenesis protein
MTQLGTDFWDDEKRTLVTLLTPRLEQMAYSSMRLAADKARITFNSELSNAQAAHWARQYTDELLQQLSTTNEHIVGQALESWISRPGATLDDLKRVLFDAGFNDRRADLIAVTETTRAYSEGEQVEYVSSGISRWRWNTNNDEVVCQFCGPLNGTIVTIGEAFGMFRGIRVTKPPYHPGCRCWMSPVVEVRQ